MKGVWAKQKRTGFTIVELLIVVVVIAILAAITIVAYAGFQNRAYDSAVQSDINNFAKKIRLYEADNGAVPTAGSKTSTPNSTLFPGMTFPVSKSVYATTEDNFYYCSGTKSGAFTFAIAARSKSTAFFIYRPESGMIKTMSGGAYAHCISGFDAGTEGYSYGYYRANNAWWSWTNG